MADPKLVIADETQEEQPEEIVVVTGDEKPETPATPEPEHDDDEDDDDDLGDLRVAAEQRDENPNDRRKRERQERKERQRLARQRKDAELADLRRQNQELARRVEQLAANQQTQAVQTVDQRLSYAKQHLDAAEAQIADATNRGDGAALTKALAYRDEAKAAIGQLERERSARTAGQPRQQPQAQAPAIDPQVAAHAQQWAQANPWFNGNADTPQVRAAKQAEAALLSEGYDPRNREFWRELTRRTNEAVAPKEQRGMSERRPTGGPKVGGANDTTARRSVEYRLSPERITAMKEAGIWDDPVKRERQIKAYRDYDKQNQSNAAR